MNFTTSHAAGNGSVLQALRGGLVSRWQAALCAWRTALERRRRAAMERRALLELRGMDDRALSDIGLARSDLYGLSDGTQLARPPRQRHIERSRHPSPIAACPPSHADRRHRHAGHRPTGCGDARSALACAQR